MKKTIIVLTFLLPVQLVAQTTICEPATTPIGQLIDKLAAEGTSSIAIRKADNKQRSENYLQATRLCEHHASTIYSLGKVIADRELLELINCDNGTLTATGFIIFCNNRRNDKEEIMVILLGITQKNYRIIANGCSDAIQVVSLGRYCLNLLTERNLFLKRNVILNDTDLRRINESIDVQEKRYLTR
jgi:hypothetical protein